MSRTPAFIRDILAERKGSAPDRVRFIGDSAAYLFHEDRGGTADTRIRKGLASARDCCCELRDRILAALDGPARGGVHTG